MSAGSSSETKTMVTLRSSDMQQYELEAAAAAMSTTIGYMIEDTCADQVIPLPNVPGRILAMVVDYCRKHAEIDAQVKAVATPATKERLEKELRDWDAKFIDVKLHVLYDLLMAANYLCIDSLLNLGASKVANIIKGKTPDEIRQIFNIKNDFTPEEYEEIKKDNSWAFER